MCGRYVLLILNWYEYGASYPELNLRGYPSEPFTSYNVAPSSLKPSTFIPVIRSAEDGEGSEVVRLRWGLIPQWAKGVVPKFSSINATVENLESAATWKGPWQRGQRCFIPATGFYEPHIAEDGSNQQFYIHCVDHENFGFAGIWDVSRNDAGDVIESYALITLPATPLMETIHNEKKRMPAILKRDDAEAWLRGSPTDAKRALKQYRDDLLVAWRVSERVGNWRNNDASLLDPI